MAPGKKGNPVGDKVSLCLFARRGSDSTCTRSPHLQQSGLGQRASGILGVNPDHRELTTLCAHRSPSPWLTTAGSSSNECYRYVHNTARTFYWVFFLLVYKGVERVLQKKYGATDEENAQKAGENFHGGLALWQLHWRAPAP